MTRVDDLQCEDCNLIMSKSDAEAYLNALNVCPTCGGSLQPMGDGSSLQGELEAQD